VCTRYNKISLFPIITITLKKLTRKIQLKAHINLKNEWTIENEITDTRKLGHKKN